jgi:MIP family channel proteins
MSSTSAPVQAPAQTTAAAHSPFKKILAEMVGTFALVFAGCGAIMTNTLSEGAVSHVGVSATFGLVVGVMILATGHICGAHFNPAVTLAFASIGRFPWREVPGYIAGQCVAAVLASLALRLLIGPVASIGATVPKVGDLQAVGLEGIFTFFLMFVITAVATDDRAAGGMAAIAIGGTVALDALFGGPLTGASMNPARTLGPALISGEFQGLWIYFVGPILGAVAGAVTYHLLRCGGKPQDAAGCC